MPNSAIVKTGWVRKQREIVLLLTAVLTIGLATIVFGTQDTKILAVGSQRFELALAVSEGERRNGLSGRESLRPNEGMLFDFGSEESRCIWMQDMHFPIDAVWTDLHRKVVHVEHGLSPETYPKNFCSDLPAAYVIELPAGSIDRTGIRKGQVLNF